MATRRNFATNRFSLKRLLVSVTLCAVASPMLLEMHRRSWTQPEFSILMWLGSSIAIGAAIVTLWGFSRRTALISVLVSWCLVAVLVYARNSPPKPKTPPAPVLAPN